MPAPDDLQPKTPGDASGAAAPDDLQDLVNMPVAELVEQLDAMDSRELTNLAAVERDTKNRKTVLQAIERALDERAPASQADTTAALAAPHPRKASHPAKGRPYLTDAGWVVPEHR